MPKTNDKNSIIITDEITTSSVDQLDNEMAQLAAYVEAEDKRELQTGGDATPVDAPFNHRAGETSLSSASNDVEFEIDKPQEDSTFYQHLFSPEVDETTLPHQTPAASETRASEPIETKNFEMIIKAEVAASITDNIRLALFNRRSTWYDYRTYNGKYIDGALHIRSVFHTGDQAELTELKELIKKKYGLQDAQMIIKLLPSEQSNRPKKIDDSPSTETHEREIIGYEIIIRGEPAILHRIALFTSGESAWTTYNYKAMVTDNKLTLQPYRDVPSINHLELIALIKEKYPDVKNNIVYNPIFSITKKRSAADNIDTQAPAAKKPVIDKLETKRLLADFCQKSSNRFFSMGSGANNMSQQSNCKSAQTLVNNMFKQ